MTKMGGADNKRIMATEYKTVYVSSDVLDQLRRLADLDHRTIGAEVSWLVEQELARRGLPLVGDNGVSATEPVSGLTDSAQ